MVEFDDQILRLRGNHGAAMDLSLFPFPIVIESRDHDHLVRVAIREEVLFLPEPLHDQ